MIGHVGQWNRTPSATPLQPKKWNACFWIMFNFWWLARLVDGCKSHLAALSSQKNENLIFGLCSTSDDQLGWLMDSNLICHPTPTKKMKYLFLYYDQLLMMGLAAWWTRTPSANFLQPNIEMLIFGLCSTSDDQLGWSMDSNHMCHLSPGIKWNAYFWITFNFWWSAVMVDGLKPHLPPLSSQKNEMIIFGLCSTSDDRLGWLMDLSPICHPSPAKKMKCSFLDYVQLLMIGWAGRWTQTPSTTPGQEKNDMLIFVLHSTSHDQLGWLMDSNPICNPYPVKKMKCSFLDYIQLLMIGQAGWRTWTPSATHLQPEKWNACFWITFKFWWLAGLVDELKPHLPPLSSQKNEMLIFGLRSTSDDWPGWSMDANPICHPSPAKSEMLIFGLRSTSDDRLSWLMDSNPIYNLSPAKKMKISFLDYVQLLMISRVGWWTQTSFATPLQPKKWNTCFCITINFWWWAWLLDGLEPHLPTFSSQILKCSFLDYAQLLMISWAGQWTQTTCATSLQA